MNNFARAVFEAHAAQFNFALNATGMHRLDWFRHAGHAIENFENPLRAGRRALGAVDNANHRFHPAVETANQAHGGDQGADFSVDESGVLLKTSHTPNAHTASNPISESNETNGPKNDQMMFKRSFTKSKYRFARSKPLDFALFLRKRFHHADAGNRVGQRRWIIAPWQRPID